MAITIKINDTEREIVQYSLSLSASLGQRASINFRVVSTDGSYRPEQGQPIELWESGTKLWAGTVDEVAEISITEAGAAAGAFYDVRGVSWEHRLDRRRCYDITTAVPAIYDRNFVVTANASTNYLTSTGNHGRSNGDKVRVKAHAQGTLIGGLNAETEYYVISATATTLQLSLSSGGAAVDLTDTGTLDQILITYRAGEIVADLVSTFAGLESIGVSNIDSGAVVDTIGFEADVSVSDAIGHLAELSGYVWWIDEDRELYFKPRTYVSAPFAIGLSTGNYRNFEVRKTREDKVNSALVTIDWLQIPVTEQTFTGDGSTRTFTLSNRAGQLVGVTVNGQEQDVGAWLAESDRAFYWQYGSVSIRHDTDLDVLTAADSIVVSYKPLGANVVLEEDSGDISSTATQEGSGSGRYQHTYAFGGGQVQAALDAQALIAARKTVVTEISYETDQNVEPLCVTLRPGQLQAIANSARGVSSGSYLIQQVGITDVGGAWLRVSVSAISGTSLVGVQEYWKAMGGATSPGGTGTTAGAGTVAAAVPAAPDNVSGLSATYEYADAETVRVTIAYTPPSPVGSFVGVHVWEEPVDQSASAAIPLNGTVALNGSANLGGTFAPIDRGRHLTSPATFYIPRPTDTATKRFYLASYSETAENELARATESNATPNITVSVSANSYQSGEEYARLVTGVGATVAYDDSQVSSPKYRFLFAWTAPTDPPAAWQRAFGGVQIVYEYADGNRANGPILAVNETSRYSDWYELFVGSAVVKCWFVSMDASAEPRLNSIIENLTPSASATVTWPLASRGGVSPYADNVTGFAASNARYATNGQGLKVLLIDFAWTKPSTAAALARWGGVIVWLHLPGGGAKFQLTGPETGATVTCEIGAFPQSTETWTFYGVSVDNNANPNADGQNPISGTPTTTLSVSPPTAGASGTEYTSHATSVSFAAATVSASDGTTQKRVTATFTGPSDVTWGGVELRVYDGSTLLASTSATPSPVAVVFPNPSSSVTVTAKLVSFDVNGRTNTEQAGTPQGTLAIGSASGTFDLTKYLPTTTDLFAISGGKIIVAANQITETAIAANSISTPKLQANAVTANIIAAGAIVAGKIAANAVAATEIAAGAVTSVKLDATEIKVGGGGSKPGKFGVYNSSGTQIGFIGTESGNEGGWFKTLSVGGSSYANGKLKADSSGGVTINDATLTLNLNGVVATVSNDLAYGVYNGIRVYSTTSGQESPVMISPGGITIGNTLTTGTKFYLNAAYGSNATMSLYDSTTAERIRLSTSTSNGAIRVYGSGSSFASLNDTTLALLSGGYVDAGGYRVSGTSGVSGSVLPVTGINTNLVTINYKDHSGNNQTASFLAFSSTTTTTLTFSGGIRV